MIRPGNWAAEVVKRLGQLNLHRRELERKLHVANGFLPAGRKNNTDVTSSFFRGEGGYRRTRMRGSIEFYRYVNPLLSREAERELGRWKGKVREIMGML